MSQWNEFVNWWVIIEPELLRTARRYNISAEAARDVVQDVAVLSIRDYARFTNQHDFRQWVHARLHWLLLDEVRENRAKAVETSEIALEHSIPPTQEKDLIISEIQRLVDQLPKRQRAAMIGMLEGRSPTTIAREMNVEVATVRSLQRFAKKRLVQLLTEQEVIL